MTPRTNRATVPGRRRGHEKVVAAVKHSLAEGRYDGGMLPSYRQLVRELNVTMANVERAMAQLEREGLIRREKRRGVFPRVRRRRVAPEKRLPLRCINFFTPIMPTFLGGDYLAGYTEALDHLDIRMRFVSGDEDNLDPDYTRLFSDRLPMKAQGLVLLNLCVPDLIEWLQRNDVPFVVQYYARYTSKNLPPHFNVYVNKAGGAFQAVGHLLELGHRDIGFMGLINDDVAFENMVFEGYRAALICAGLDCDEDRLANCTCTASDKPAVAAIAKDFLSRRNRPTAIVAGCDEFALSLIDAARSLNLRVPEDLSIIGFDNQPGSDRTSPPLTTVSVPRRELARSAVELLLQAARTSRVPPQTRILETHFIIRETTAPPPAARAGNSPKLSSRAVPSE